MDRRRVSRQELYELVWSNPTSELARRFGLSDVGLAKLCDRLDVPRPGRGYWAKIRGGAKLKRPPLPKRESGKPTAVDLSPHVDEERAKPTAKAIPVEVPKALRNPHPLVEQSKKLLAGREPDEFGRVHPPNKECLAIRVSPKSLDRALRIMDALLKAIEARGRSVRIAVGYNNRLETQLLYGNEDVNFEIWEDSSQRILVLASHGATYALAGNR